MTVVHPGGTRTERTAEMIAARVEAGVPEEDTERRLAEGNSIRHLVDARDAREPRAPDRVLDLPRGFGGASGLELG